MSFMPDMSSPLSWRERIDTVGGRRRDLMVVAVVVAAVVFTGLAIWGRGAPPRIAPPVVGATLTEPAPSRSAGLLVHVAGAVRRPGVYSLAIDARVADAIEEAGGPLRRADLDALNLAAPVVDGAQILVPVRGRNADPGIVQPDAAMPGSSQDAVVSINTADQVMLETIPGIGPVTAAAILEHRISIGSFDSIDQLLDVTGIGPATLESMRPYVTL